MSLRMVQTSCGMDRLGTAEWTLHLCLLAGHALEGNATSALEWSRGPCCSSQWRLEDDGFALRPGRIVEEGT